jgi:hypothetical protein
MAENKFEAAIGMSRKWDAREAGREVARSAIKQLDRPPNFFILFSTIHYGKHGGFQELLNGVYDVLPAQTLLIGGTVTGFMNNYGCYARGATALVISSTDMDIVLGLGKNTKRNPKKAAKRCANMIKNGLKDSRYENKFILNLISASEIPNIPFVGRKKIYTKGFSTKVLLRLFGFSQYVLQKGAGRDDEVIEEMTKQLPDYYMLGGGTLDDGANYSNFQFFNKEVLTNSVVSLGIRSNFKLDVFTTHNMEKTGINFKITKASKDGRMIHEINGESAASQLIKLLNWPKDFLREETWYKTTYYFPIGFKINKQNEIGPRVIGSIFGESLITVIRSKDDDASILTIDGRKLLETIDNNLGHYHHKPEFGLISSCSTRMITMGDRTYRAREHIQKYFGNSPFIVFYVGGESTYSPKKGLNYVNMSFNSAIFWDEKSSTCI